MVENRGLLMLTAAGVALAGVAAAPGALGQTPSAQPPTIERPDWRKRPRHEDMLKALPAEALRRGRDGGAAIRCETSAEGTLRRCVVVREDPPGLGYGAAALTLAPLFQLTPQKVNGVPVAGGTVTIPIRWKVPSAGVAARGDEYVMDPLWIAAPTRAEVAAAYPQRALAAGAGAQAVLDCRVSKTGALERCRTAGEEPSGLGAGEAALKLAPLFRMAPALDEAGRPRSGFRVRMPVRFSPDVRAADAPQIARAEWGRLPDAARMGALYPAEAKAAGVKSGTAVLDCRVASGGSLAGCTIARETPAGLGFGRAALLLAPSFAMKPWTSDGRPVDGARVRVPVRYQDEG